MTDQRVESPAESIGTRAGRGLRWAIGANLVMKVVSFALSLAMVRLLDPHDFGLYAVAFAANAFLIHVNDMGMIAATVQWRGDADQMMPTANTLAVAFSLAWYGLFWVGAPILAHAAGSPEAVPLVRLLSFTIVLDGLTAVAVGTIQRRFEQDKLMKAIVIGFACCAMVNLTLAMAGAGAYSFVLGSLAQAVVVAALVLRTARVPFRFGLDRVVARRLLVFGIPLAAGLAVESVVMYSDSVIVGHVLGTAMLGFYLLAWNISSWAPGLVGAAVRYVSVPAFSRLAENESETGSETFSHSVQRVLPLMFAFVVPIAASLMVLSPALIGTLYGPHWLPAGEALRFLAVVMMARLLTALVFDIQTGLGNTKMTVWLNLAWLAALLPALWIGAHRDGIRGVAMGHAFVAVTVAMPLAGWFLHRAGVDVRPIVRRCVRPLLAGTAAGLAMTVMSWALHAGVLQLLVGGSTGLLLYLCLVVPAEGRVATRSWVAVHLRSRRETLA